MRLVFILLLFISTNVNAQIFGGHFFYTAVGSGALYFWKESSKGIDTAERWAVGSSLLVNGLKELSDSQFNTGNSSPTDFGSGFISGPSIVLYGRWYFNRKKKERVKFK